MRIDFNELLRRGKSGGLDADTLIGIQEKQVIPR